MSLYGFDVSLKSDTPYIGVIKEGYGLYLTGAYHTESRRFPFQQHYAALREDYRRIGLTKQSLEAMITEPGNIPTSSFVMNLEAINRSDCWWERIPRTLQTIDKLYRQLDRQRRASIRFFGIEEIQVRPECRSVNEVLGEAKNEN